MGEEEEGGEEQDEEEECCRGDDSITLDPLALPRDSPCAGVKEGGACLFAAGAALLSQYRT